MATIITTADIVQVSFVCQVEDQFMFNVFDFDILNSTGGGLTDAQFSVAVDNLMAPLYKALLASSAAYFGSKTQIILPTRIDPQFNKTNAGAGTLAGDQLPTQTCGLISWRTGFAGRSFRGRTYLPAASEGINDSVAQPSAAYITAATAFANALMGFNNIVVGPDSLSFALSVFSRSTGDLTVIESFEVREDWATQRRRSRIKHSDSLPF